jgi:hypothetical protein
LGFDAGLGVAAYGDGALDGAVSAEGDAHPALANLGRNDRRCKAHGATVHLDEGVAFVGAHDEGAGDGREHGARAYGLAGGDGDGLGGGLIPVGRDVERVRTGRELQRAWHRAPRRALRRIDTNLSPRHLAAHLDAPEDGHEAQRDGRLLPEPQGDPGRLGGFVPGQFGDDAHGTGGEGERARRGPARAQVAAVDVERGACGLGVDAQYGDVGRDAGEGSLQRREGLAVGLALHREGVRAVRVGVALKLLVRPRDVEQHVAIGHEPVGREEVLERPAEVSGPVALGAELEVQVGLVGEVVGAGDARGSEGDQEAEGPHPAGGGAGHWVGFR